MLLQAVRFMPITGGIVLLHVCNITVVIHSAHQNLYLLYGYQPKSTAAPTNAPLKESSVNFRHFANSICHLTSEAFRRNNLNIRPIPQYLHNQLTLIGVGNMKVVAAILPLTFLPFMPNFFSNPTGRVFGKLQVGSLCSGTPEYSEPGADKGIQIIRRCFSGWIGRNARACHSVQ